MIMASALVVVACANCGAKNRVSLNSALKKQPVCGKCRAELPAPADGIVRLRIWLRDADIYAFQFTAE